MKTKSWVSIVVLGTVGFRGSPRTGSQLNPETPGFSFVSRNRRAGFLADPLSVVKRLYN